MQQELINIPIIGEGKEFIVYRSTKEDNTVYKKPKDSNAWADNALSIVDYHVSIHQFLKSLGFSELLPEKFEKDVIKELGEVIKTEDSSNNGSDSVIALEELDTVDNPKILAILRIKKIDAEQIAAKVKELRRILLGSGSQGLMDELGLKNIVMGADAFHIIIKESGEVDVILDDFGTVLFREDLDHQTINEQNYNCVITLLYKLSTLVWISQNKL